MTSSIFSVFSWCLGLLDQSVSILHYLLGDNNVPKFFSSGWGDVDAAFKAHDMLMERLKNYQTGYLYNGVKIKWNEPPILVDHVITVTEGRFLSPLADQLPQVAKECQIFLVRPSTSRTTESVKTVVVMLPATGEMSKRARLSMARQLASDHGWASVIVTAPFYGLRKPPDQQHFFISNVQDFLLQSQAIMEETAAIVSYYQQQSDANNNTRVCITGFSWGGAMACGAASIATLAGCDASRIALVPYVGCPSPAAIAEGILHRYLHVERLRKSPNGTITNAKASLRSVLADVSITPLIDMIEKRRQESDSVAKKSKVLYLGALKVVAMQHDHIIPYQWASDLVFQLGRLCSTTTTTARFPTQWLPGGHVMAALVKSRVQTTAIVEAVQALEIG